MPYCSNHFKQSRNDPWTDVHMQVSALVARLIFFGLEGSKEIAFR